MEIRASKNNVFSTFFIKYHIGIIYCILYLLLNVLSLTRKYRITSAFTFHAFHLSVDSLLTSSAIQITIIMVFSQFTHSLDLNYNLDVNYILHLSYRPTLDHNTLDLNYTFVLNYKIGTLILQSLKNNYTVDFLTRL